MPRVRRRHEDGNVDLARSSRSESTASSLNREALEVGPIRIDKPTHFVVVVPDLVAGRLSGHDLETLGAATALVSGGAGAVVCVVFGHCETDLGAAGVDRVILYPDPAGYRKNPEARVASLVTVHAALRPVHWLFADSRSGGGDLGRRLAARLRVRAATDVHRIDGETVMRGAKGGGCDQVVAKAPILVLREGALPPFTGPAHEGRSINAPEVTVVAGRVTELDDDRVPPDAIALEEADFIMSGGNGVRDWETFHELSRALGAAEGASRVAVDAGCMPRERQIGASGRAISARVYFAIGISGAPQHMQGIQRCEKVIAINADRNCDMVRRSDIAVIGDAAPIMKAMCKESRLQHGAR